MKNPSPEEIATKAEGIVKDLIPILHEGSADCPLAAISALAMCVGIAASQSSNPEAVVLNAAIYARDFAHNIIEEAREQAERAAMANGLQ